MGRVDSRRIRFEMEPVFKANPLLREDDLGLDPQKGRYTMKTITLNNGVKMPVIGLGTWDLRGKNCERVVQTAIDEGYRLIDTAQMYENEEEIGRATRQSGVPREHLFITTKLCRPSDGYEAAARDIEISLRRLRTDYIDLLLIHEVYSDPQGMYRAFKDALRAGKVRAIGISNFMEDDYRTFADSCEIIPAVNQVEAHVYLVRQRLQSVLNGYGTVMQAWAPFTQGKKNLFVEPVLVEIGLAHGKSAAQVALRYLIQNGMAAVPKSAKRERLKENLNIFDFTLSHTELGHIAQLDEGKSLFGWY